MFNESDADYEACRYFISNKEGVSKAVGREQKEGFEGLHA